MAKCTWLFAPNIRLLNLKKKNPKTNIFKIGILLWLCKIVTLFQNCEKVDFTKNVSYMTFCAKQTICADELKYAIVCWVLYVWASLLENQCSDYITWLPVVFKYLKWLDTCTSVFRNGTRPWIVNCTF